MHNRPVQAVRLECSGRLVAIASDSNGLVTVEHSTPDSDILIVTNLWPRTDKGSYGIFVKRQVASLVEAGARVDVLFVRGYRSPTAYAAAAAQLAAWNLTRPDYKIVHAHGGEAAIPARAYVRAPLVVSYCGDDLLGTVRPDGSVTLARRLRRTVLRQHARLAAHTITKSAEMEARLPASIRGKNRVIPNGVDFELFDPVTRETARQRLGWGLDERIVLFAADPTVPRKRYSLAVEACRNAETVTGPIRLHVANATPPDEMPLLMSAASCLILTSTAEGSPNVVKEAIASNLPVVATRVGDVETLLADVEPSWIVEGTPEALGAAVAAAVAKPIRSNGRERGAWLRSEQIAARVLAVYDEVAAL